MGNSYNICFVGGSCTGKSTLAQAVTVALKMRHLDVEYVPEYARTYLRRVGDLTHYLEQFVIFMEHCRREDERRIHDIVVSDSASFIMQVYMLHYPPQNLDEVNKHKWEYHFRILQALSAMRLAEYSQIFYVPGGVFPLRGDPTRQDMHRSDDIGDGIKTYLEANAANYYVVQEKSLEDRVEEVIRQLEVAGLPGLESSSDRSSKRSGSPRTTKPFKKSS